MKKSLSILVLLVISLVFSACGAKAPFEAKQPLPEAALVYVYVVKGMSSGEDASHADYNIRINGKRYLERIESGEYMVFNLKPNPTLMSAVKSQIIEEHIKLDLKAGDINYLRITDNVAYGEFGFEQVSASVAKEEIVKTGLAGSSLESPDNIITELIGLEDEDDSLVGDKSNKVPALTEAQIDAIIEKKLAQRSAANGGQAIVEEKSSAFTPSVTNSTSKTGISKASKMSKIKEAYDMKQQGIITDEEFQTLKADILAK